MIEIKVTEKHINRGLRGECGACPIALAVNESLGDKYFSTVNPAYDDSKGHEFVELVVYTSSQSLNGEVAVFDIDNQNAVDFIHDFDSGMIMPAPVTFNIEGIELKDGVIVYDSQGN